jgi:predicted DNA-binding WGR domain protein
MQHIAHTTPLPYHIHLQAVELARNIARDYRIEVTKDLFGHIIVALHWGRIGTKGQSRVVSFSGERSAQRFIRSALTKRKSAKKRIGVAYHLCS